MGIREILPAGGPEGIGVRWGAGVYWRGCLRGEFEKLLTEGGR